tara:strand:+ start:34 stop:387 length:354 start_codon:yes stop_codon:yes gene_type:complete
MTTKLKRGEVKFETSKEFLTANKNQVLSSLKNEFYFENINLKELAIKYFNFISTSKHYFRYFTLIMDKKTTSKVIDSSVRAFRLELKENGVVFGTNFENKNTFQKERELASRNSKSI